MKTLNQKPSCAAENENKLLFFLDGHIFTSGPRITSAEEQGHRRLAETSGVRQIQSFITEERRPV